VSEPEVPAGHDPELEAIAAERAGGFHVIPSRVEWLNLDDLERHPDNANEGDVGAIEARIDAIGFYGALIVQDPAFSDETDKHRVIDGEHRIIAVRHKGGLRVRCDVHECDDDTARRILAGNNRTVRLGRDRPDDALALLAKLAETERGLDGTSYDYDDLEVLRIDADRSTAEALAAATDQGLDHGRMGAHAECPKCGHTFALGKP